jgi:hypothetical protein
MPVARAGSRRSISIAAAVLAALIVAPRYTSAQSSKPTKKLTANVAEHALAPGTTEDAAEAWLQHWGIKYDVVPPENCCYWLGTRKIPAETKIVLAGYRIYPIDAISADIVSVYVFLDADNMVLRVMAEDGGMIE